MPCPRFARRISAPLARFHLNALAFWRQRILWVWRHQSLRVEVDDAHQDLCVYCSQNDSLINAKTRVMRSYSNTSIASASRVRTSISTLVVLYMVKATNPHQSLSPIKELHRPFMIAPMISRSTPTSSCPLITLPSHGTSNFFLGNACGHEDSISPPDMVRPKAMHSRHDYSHFLGETCGRH